MKRFVGSILLAGVASVGCAHEAQVPKTAAAPTAPSPRPNTAARVAPAPAPEAAAPVAKGDDAIYFDFDSSLVRSDARPVLQKVGAVAKERAASVKVEGNCDETGTIEYNLALGEARARSAKDYLVHLGLPASRIAIASWGSQRPRDPGHDEAAHAQNRRDDLLIR